MAKTPEEKAADKAKKEAEKAPASVSAADAAAAGEKGSEGQTISPTPEAKPAKATSTDPVTVKYLDHEGKPTERTFSADVHGEDFAKLAEEFKATNASRIIA